MKKLQFCLVLLSLLVLALGAFAQVQNGQFTGIVTDPSGAAIANAKVTVTNIGTNLSVSTTTNAAGVFTAKELPVGTYKISAEASGFKTSTSEAQLNAGTIQHVEFKMQLGQAREVVEVSGEVSAVNTEDSKLANTVNDTQVANLPLNGRNIYDLIQLSPGAVNVRGVVSESGANTVVNGLRENFNGFLINGSSNKGMSGGAVTQPVEDTVQEFQELTLNMSAQYGNSAGSVTNLVTKGGTNAFHGSGWEFNRNDIFDANNFLLNQAGVPKQALRFNQFGGTIGGPIIKDKLFFFLSYQGDHFRESAPPTAVAAESSEWRQAVISALPNSTAALLYSNFPPTSPAISDNAFLGSDLTNYLCADANGSLIASRLQAVLGVTALDQANAVADGCATPLPLTTGTFNRASPLEVNTIAINGSQNQTFTGEGNLFNGWEGSARLDYNASAKDRLLFQLNWNRLTDRFGFPNTVSNSNGRGAGFLNPAIAKSPNGQLSFIHTFSPTILNEFRAGYALNIVGDVTTALPGVPDIRFDDGSMGFGSYAGYPQTFHENIYTYSDMVSISHGNHNMKVGIDFRRNLENSEFNVARSSYYFFDPVYFAADAPYTQTSGVDPGILSNQPAQLASNIRHWRNLEMGAYFQDDWKVTRNLTLNLGLRYDLYTRHNELNDQVTTFIPGPGNTFLDNLATGAGYIQQASVPGGTVGTIGGTSFDCTSTASIGVAQLAPSAVPSGVSPCGPGGFATASTLGAGDHNNFGPRVGFAWDVFGNAKTSLRGGFGVSYEGTLYNPLSNSRWNLPYYSFNNVSNGLVGDVNTVIYGPYTGSCTQADPTCNPDTVTPPSYLGTPTNPHQGTGAQAVGNLTGWDAANPNLAFLTGIVLPQGIKDPYVYNYFLGVQHELMSNMVFEVNYVGTTAHKLFRAENVNRQPGERLPAGTCVVDEFGRNICSREDPVTDPVGRLNPNFGTLRIWENVVNSNYNALQLSLRKRASHGITFNFNYTWSHAIDGGSTWHSGSTSSNGAGAGDGYTTDATLPSLDRGNSIFDIRHRVVANFVYELPWYKNQEGVVGHVLGGWQYNGIITWQSGAHWEPWTFSNGGDPVGSIVNGSGGTCTQADIDAHDCTNTGGDFNLDGVRNDRPNVAASNFSPSHDQWANGWGSAFQFTGGGSSANGFFSSPCLGCDGNEGRNTFVGPSYVSFDTSLFKNIKITERVNAQFRAEAFNLFNHTNFQLPGAGGATNNRTNSAAFGEAGGVFAPRQLQFGLKINF